MLAEEPRFTIVARGSRLKRILDWSGVHDKKSCRHPFPDEKTR